MRLTAIIPFVALGLTAACASTPQISLTPLSVISQPEASYLAVVGAHPKALEPPAINADGTDKNVQIEVLMDLMQMDRDTLENLVGWAHGARAWTTTLEEAQAVVAAAKEVRGMQLQAPRLMLFGGQSGSVSVINQVAYVRNFEVQIAGYSMIADPVIDVAQDGLLLEVTAELGSTPNAVALDLNFKLADLQRPFAEQKVKLPGTSTDAWIQLPIAAVQTLTTKSELKNDQCLVLLAHVVDDPDAFYVILVHAQRI